MNPGDILRDDTRAGAQSAVDPRVSVKTKTGKTKTTAG
jgi:hypothetical protein